MKTENFLLWIFACSAVLCLAACSDEYMLQMQKKWRVLSQSMVCRSRLSPAMRI